MREFASPPAQIPCGPAREAYTAPGYEHGEGLYSVVVLTDRLDEDRERMAPSGATMVFHQDRSGDGFTLVEAMLAPVLGMPITLLATDLVG